MNISQPESWENKLSQLEDLVIDSALLSLEDLLLQDLKVYEPGVYARKHYFDGGS